MKKFQINILCCLLSALCISMNVEAKPNDKDIQKEVNKLTQEGWHTFPQDPSLKMQLEDDYNARYIFNEELYPAYIVVGGTSDPCELLSEALAQATAEARLNIALTFESEIDAVIERSEDQETYTTKYKSGYSYQAIKEPLRDYQYTVFFYNNEKLMENTQIGDEATTKRYWKAIMQYWDVLPVAKQAWCLMRLWRHTDKGYEALVEVCYYSNSTQK